MLHQWSKLLRAVHFHGPSGSYGPPRERASRATATFYSQPVDHQYPDEHLLRCPLPIVADLIEYGLLQVERIFFEGGFDWLESGKGGVGIVPALGAELRSIDILSHLLGFEGQ